MADPLRREDLDFPNQNVVPPAAPYGSADPATSSGSTMRGDFVVPDDDLLEVDYEDSYRRESVNGLIDGAMDRVHHVLNTAKHRVRNVAGSLSDGSLRAELSDRVEEFKGRAADLADDVEEAAVRLSRDLRYRTEEIGRSASLRVRKTRAQAQRYINEEPVKALAVAVGVGFVVGVLLRVGRSRSEY